ncbi:MAG: MFS transporter [Candidatus Thorarchaeota archaeon]|nr:MAG: MFS transporter [Candidatus Thorarchaeota archaeon]
MGLRASEHKWNLLALYFVTLIMRASFYISIASIQDPAYMGTGLELWAIGAVLVIYPFAELASVSFFGSYSDRIGRRPIFVGSLFITGAAAFLFAITPNIIVLFLASAVFGIGAASKVSTTLSMIADMSDEHNRARLMGYYDLSTLFGLVGGFGLGVLLLTPEIGFTPFIVLASAGSACAVSGVIALLSIKETREHIHVEISIFRLLREVASDRKIQQLIPVYVPIISMYGMLIGYAKIILHDYFTLTAIDMIILFGMLGGALILGIIVMGHLSDYYMKRRPFIAFGLIGFGILAFLLVSNSGPGGIEALWSVWPLLPTFGFIAGAFPPAAMAYLTDVAAEDSRGTTMGVYSIFFGSGMIIGPTLGGVAYGTYGLIGMAVLVAILIAVAIAGTYFMPEVRSEKTEKSLAEQKLIDA